jgi:hypothetical protein
VLVYPPVFLWRLAKKLAVDRQLREHLSRTRHGGPSWEPQRGTVLEMDELLAKRPLPLADRFDTVRLGDAHAVPSEALFARKPHRSHGGHADFS